MNAVPHILNEDINTPSDRESEATVDVEPSNIISLSEQGLLLRGADFKPAEEVGYHQYSPLNEW